MKKAISSEGVNLWCGRRPLNLKPPPMSNIVKDKTRERDMNTRSKGVYKRSNPVGTHRGHSSDPAEALENQQTLKRKRRHTISSERPPENQQTLNRKKGIQTAPKREAKVQTRLGRTPQCLFKNIKSPYSVRILMKSYPEDNSRNKHGSEL